MLRALSAVLFLIGLAVAPARAGDYTDAVNKQSKCESAGELAQSFHGATQEKLRLTVSDIDKKVKAKELPKKLGGDTQYLIWIGYSAKSPKDAYMQAWAWCMDQK